MATFGEMISDLTLLGMSNINSTDLGTLINKVNREEVESWNWSFLYTNKIIWGVPPYSTGTITLTQGSNLVGGAGTIFTPNMVGWFLNVGPTQTTPIIVNAFVDAQTLQLDAAWGQPTLTLQSYSLYPLYYDVYPLVRVFRVRQIDFLTQISPEALNRIDPSRVSTGGDPAFKWANGPFTNDSPPHFQIELWPRPSSALPYIVDGKLGHVQMYNPNDQPQLPSTVIEAKASMYLCKSAFASNGNPKWFQLAQDYKADYQAELEKAKAEDSKRKVTLGMSATGTFVGGANLGEDYYAIHDSYGPPEG